MFLSVAFPNTVILKALGERGARNQGPASVVSVQMLPVIFVSLLTAIKASSVRAVDSQSNSEKCGDPAVAVCRQIEGAISSASDVYWPGDSETHLFTVKRHLLTRKLAAFEYEQDIGHYALSSTQMAACSVEPGSPEDVGTIVRVNCFKLTRTSHSTFGCSVAPA